MRRGNKRGEEREREGVLRSTQRRRGKALKQVMACCDKHWLKSLSRSDTTVRCVSLLTRRGGVPHTNTQSKSPICDCHLKHDPNAPSSSILIHVDYKNELCISLFCSLLYSSCSDFSSFSLHLLSLSPLLSSFSG